MRSNHLVQLLYRGFYLVPPPTRRLVILPNEISQSVELLGRNAACALLPQQFLEESKSAWFEQGGYSLVSSAKTIPYSLKKKP